MSSAHSGRPASSGGTTSFWGKRGTSGSRLRTCSTRSVYSGGGPSKIRIAPTCMWLLELSLVRNEASTAVRRSRWRPEVAIAARLLMPEFAGPQALYPEGMPATVTAPKRVLLAAPRGYCAGVDRAVQTVERALALHGAPVYVRKEIVHNKHVVEELAKRGAIFVEEETEVPEGAIVVFS